MNPKISFLDLYGSRFIVDLPDDLIFGGRCHRCARTGPIDRERVARRWPWERLSTLEQRLRCIDCQQRDGNSLTIYARRDTGKKPHNHADKFAVDLYADGSSVFRLDAQGNELQIEAWAKNASVARAAFSYLLGEYPGETFLQRRRAWIESDGRDPRVVEELAPPAKAKAE